ncbi:MAG: hypothetical protein GYA52_07230 [Chloroflexi bacterium]|nr:hypothetical protein [Chloroflexota bacterium]
MNEWSSTPEFEENVSRAFNVPPIRKDFVAQVYRELMQRADARSRKRRSSLRLRPAWSIMFVILALLMIGTLVIGPQRVYAEVLKFIGIYVPGVGVVEEGTSIRVLAEPVTQTRDGITVTVHEAYLTDEKTIILYSIQNVPNSALSHDENVAGCSEAGDLILPDGTKLEIISGQGSSGYQAEYTYPAIPESIHTASFVLPCMQGTLPGKAPENWELALHFVPAPSDLNVAPLIDLPTPTAPVPQPAGTEQFPSVSSDPYGIEMGLDQIIPLADGYYLIGHTDWKDARITSAYPGSWAMKAYGAGSHEIPLEPVSFWDVGLEDPQPNQWIYKIYGTIFNAPVTLRTTLMAVEFAEPIRTELDPRAYGFDDLDSKLNEISEIEPVIMDIPGVQAQIVQMKYMQQGMLKGFEFGIEAEAGLQSLPFALQSEVSGGRGASGGGSNRDEFSGLVQTYVLSDGQMTFPMLLSADSANLAGTWETSWTPPMVDYSTTPMVVPQACLTLHAWKQAVQDPPMLPEELEGTLLLSRGAMAPNPSLFLAALKGGEERGLAFGTGSLSSDGTKLVYSNEFSQIVFMDIETGQEKILTSGSADFNPIWSPDGRQIAFTRTNENLQIYTMNADGTNLNPMEPASNSIQLAAWSPDSQKILYSLKNGNGIRALYLYDTISESHTFLFEVNSEAPSPVFSPDGQWIAYRDRVPGRMTEGVYISQTTGSEKRLLVQLDYWVVGNLRWSPDGRWLAFSVLNTDQFTPTATTGLLELETCRVIPLDSLDGVIQSWVEQ